MKKNFVLFLIILSCSSLCYAERISNKGVESTYSMTLKIMHSLSQKEEFNKYLKDFRKLEYSKLSQFDDDTWGFYLTMNNSECKIILKSTPDGYLNKIIIYGTHITPADMKLFDTTILTMLLAMGISDGELDYLMKNSKDFNTNKYLSASISSVWINSISSTISLAKLKEYDGRYSAVISNLKDYKE